jgi:gas vesicle protein
VRREEAIWVLPYSQDQDQEKNMSDNNNGTSGLGWFLAGLGLGAIAGVLYAPKAGRETRDDLLNGALDAKERAATLAQQGINRAGDYVEQGKGLVQDQQDKLHAAVEAGKDAYASTTDSHSN